MTKRQKIAETFKAGLQTITTAAGYRTTFPTVTHWANLDVIDISTSVVDVMDRVNTNTDTDQGEDEKLQIEIRLGCCSANANYTTIVNMIDDIKKWYGTNRETVIRTLNVVNIMLRSDEVATGRNSSGKEIGVGKVLFDVTTGQHANWVYDDYEY